MNLLLKSRPGQDNLLGVPKALLGLAIDGGAGQAQGPVNKSLQFGIQLSPCSAANFTHSGGCNRGIAAENFVIGIQRRLPLLFAFIALGAVEQASDGGLGNFIVDLCQRSLCSSRLGLDGERLPKVLACSV